MIRNLIYRIVRKCLSIYKEESDKTYYRKYNLPPSFRFNGENIMIYGKGMFIAGPDTYIGSYSTIQLSEGYKVEIGKGCRISHNVRIYTRSLNGDTDLSDKRMYSYKTGDVIIEDYVWIGANVFINPGITIGSNAIVGANSVLTKDVAPNSIVGGVPARLIRIKNYKK